MTESEKKTSLIVISILLLWNIAVLSPVIFELLKFPKLKDLAYLFFSPLCHQIDGRSFHLMDIKLAVCNRCSSIYFGALLGAIEMRFNFSRMRKIEKHFNSVLLLAVIPTAVEFIFEKILQTQIIGLKIAAGFWLGFIAGAVLSFQLVQIFAKSSKI